jgi:uncharacterized protein (DUF1778 family)
MKMIRRPLETGLRQPGGGRRPANAPSGAHNERVHITIHRKWLRLVEKAARRQNLGRSHFIAKAAYAMAQDELAKDEVTND